MRAEARMARFCFRACGLLLLAAWLLACGEGFGDKVAGAVAPIHPSELVGVRREDFLQRFGEPCLVRGSTLGEQWLYNQREGEAKLLPCSSAWERLWVVTFSAGGVCLDAHSEERP